MDFSIARHAVWRESAETPKPDVSFIPAMERRRLTGVERAALSTAWQVRVPRETPVVFASRWGEIGVTLKLMEQFQADGEMSPAGFSASVHNAAPGAFSLLTNNHAPYTAIAARARSLEAGLLEALTRNREVIYVYAEERTPAFYQPEFGTVQTGCSVAVRFVPEKGGGLCCAFRHRDRPPAAFEDFVSFLDGRTPSFATADLELSRRDRP
ncbi:MAG: beta-ketoacyl synthase chain length factor [Kiritimatiellia bacterium]